MDESKKLVLNKKAILQAPDIQTELVFIPEWNGWVNIRGLSGSQRDIFESSMLETRGTTQVLHMEHVRSKLCSLCLVEEDGNRLFTDDEIGDLGAKSAQALQRIFNVAQRLSGLDQADVENIAKN